MMWRRRARWRRASRLLVKNSLRCIGSVRGRRHQAGAVPPHRASSKGPARCHARAAGCGRTPPTAGVRSLVAFAYSTRKGREKGTKTDVVKHIPVHPTLAAMLAEWKLGGWAAMIGRHPEPDDLITGHSLEHETISRRSDIKEIK
jgi:hypothetical protein